MFAGIEGLEVTELDAEVIVADDRWSDISLEERRAAALAAQMAASYATRASDATDPDAERVLVKAAGNAWRHGLLQSRYSDGTARVLMLDGPSRQVWHVKTRNVIPMQVAA